MSPKLSEFVTNAQRRLEASEDSMSSLEQTHDWETRLHDHSAYQSSWAHGIYSWGLHIYVANTRGFDVTWEWGSAYSSTSIYLGDGNDKVYGNLSSDKVHTGAGNDFIRGGAGNDQLLGGDGDDIIYGDYGDDILFGGNGDDTLYAGTGNNARYYGTKVLPHSGLSANYYGDGDDILFGGDGRDKLIGGKGDDVFVLGAAGDNDLIKDFARGDQIDFVGDAKVTLYAKTNGKDTLLLNGSGDDAEIYATLRGFTDTLSDADVTLGITIVDLDIV